MGLYHGPSLPNSLQMERSRGNRVGAELLSELIIPFILTNDLHRGRYHYMLCEARMFCREIEKVQAQIRDAPGAVQSMKDQKWDMSGQEMVADAQKTEDDSSDSHSTTSGSESEQEQAQPPPSKKMSKKDKKRQGQDQHQDQNQNQARKQKQKAGSQARHEKKRKWRQQNKTHNVAVARVAAPTAANALAFASGALPPAPSSAALAVSGHNSGSDIAVLAQNEVLRTIGNALLQKVSQW